ncbi:DNA-directed RNA polymerase III subunit 2 isoform X2 [Cucumis melo var. makuwa]|uniref:DNA-directed RNA polymerase n=1 Tax=Cucumis melo var. makuwa TaxID=1194695 RepID=A0A5D3BY88_CUCMM|nr:DNA-directed RNA polymerase III subunit 2 isoform X2 [Cucumis melo var. makuwa]
MDMMRVLRGVNLVEMPGSLLALLVPEEVFDAEDEIIQKKSPSRCLQPSVRALCMNANESLLHLVLLCPHSSFCWNNFFSIFDIDWVFDASLSSLVLSSLVLQLLEGLPLPKKPRLIWLNFVLITVIGRALGILRDVFLANVPVYKNNFHPKCIYVAVMMRRMMDAILSKDAMDDKDYVGNKRLELSGQLISLLFEDLFKTMVSEVKKTIDKLLGKHSRSSRFDFSQKGPFQLVTGMSKGSGCIGRG